MGRAQGYRAQDLCKSLSAYSIRDLGSREAFELENSARHAIRTRQSLLELLNDPSKNGFKLSYLP